MKKQCLTCLMILALVLLGQASAAATASPEVGLQYLGHSAYLLKHGNFSLLIDPFLDNSPIKENQLAPQYILVTHKHQDHVGEADKIGKRTGATVIAPTGVMGGKVVTVSVGEKIQFDFGWVMATPARHPQAPGAAVGFLIHYYGVTVYHAGDTYYLPEMDKVARENPVDVALLPIGGNYTMNTDDALKLAALIKPKLAIPMHYGTFPEIGGSAAEFRQKATALGIAAQSLNFGQTLTIRDAVE